MGVLRVFEADDYRPEYSLLVLNDPAVEWPDEEPEIPNTTDALTSACPCVSRSPHRNAA